MLVANLPYNVATPLVCDLLDGVPAIDRMLVMVQREVAERLCAPARLASVRRGQREGRVLGDGADRRPRAGVGVRAPPERRVGARRDRPPTGTRRDADPDALFPLVRTAFGQRRKMLRRSLADVVDGRACSTRPASTAERRPEELDVDDWVPARPSAVDRRCCDRRRRSTRPAKLTLSLRITGVRDDGYHLIDAEMVTLDLADELTIDRRPATALTATGPFADGVPLDELEPRRQGAARSPDAPRGVHDRQARSRTAAGSAAVRPTPRRCCAGPGSRRPSSRAARLGADVPFCLVGGRARVRGIGEIVEPLPYVDRSTSRWSIPPLRVSTPAAYRAWDELGRPERHDGPNDLEPAAIVVEPALAGWRDRIADGVRRHADAGRQRGDVVRRTATTTTPRRRWPTRRTVIVAARAVAEPGRARSATASGGGTERRVGYLPR